MDKQESWKRTDEIEIDLMDLLRRVCGQWKRIVLCAAACAVLLGGYGWMKGTESTDAEAPAALEDVELTEDEQKAVEDAVQLAKDNQELETYLENSLLMQADPYHKARQALLYCIDRADRQNLAAVTESYLNYTANGGAAEELGKSYDSWKMDRSYLAELITAYQKTYSYPYQAVLSGGAASSQLAESLFYVEITGKDAGEAREMARDMQQVLEKYSAQVKKTAGSHRLRLVSSAESITADSDLKARQRDRKSQLSSGRESLKTMTAAFSREQMAAYQKASGDSGEEKAADKKNSSEKETAASGRRKAFQYGLLGFLAGICAYGCIYACWYVFSGTVKHAEEIKRRYVFPVYGQLQPGKSGRKHGSIKQHALENTEAQVLNRIRLACKKQGVEKLCAASDYPLAGPERECLEKMAGQLAEYGIRMSVAESIRTDTAAWDFLAETGNVLLVCRAGMTTYQAIDDVMGFFVENGISVAGAMLFSESDKKKTALSVGV